MPNSEPYTRDVEFPSSFVHAQSPLVMSCAAALRGFEPPLPAGSFAYCELGCSTGTTLNPLAAVNPEASFVGVDFNAGHIKKAASAARAASVENVSYVESSFIDLADHDLPEFEFIAMNGTYSWLTPDVEAAVVQFVSRHLKPGGLFYVDYMSLPGKASVEPLWRLMRVLTEGHEGDSTARVREGLALLNQLGAQGAGYFESNPTAVNVLQAITEITRDPVALRHTAHHTLAAGWQAKYFTDVVTELEPAGLRFAGSATLLLNDPRLCIPRSQQQLLESRPDGQAELLKDFILDSPQRKDVFIKAAPDAAGAAEFLRNRLQVMSVAPLAEIRRNVAQRGRGNFEFADEVYGALVGALKRPTSLADAAATPALAAYDDDRLLDAFRTLVATELLITGACAVPQEMPTDAPRAVRIPLAVNRAMLKDSVKRGLRPMLVSPATGCASLSLAMTVPEAALLEGLADAGQDKAAARAQRLLKTCKKRVMVRGKVYPADQVPLPALKEQLLEMQRSRIPLLRMYQIVEAK